MIGKIKLFLIIGIILLSRFVYGQTSIPISLNTTSNTHSLNAVENGDGSYSITTTGGDPYLSAIDLTTVYDYNSTFYISFDYISVGGLDDLTIYYGTPSEDRKVDAGAVAPASTYKTMVINMKRKANWNTNFTKFRFDFGTTSGYSIQVKNITLRTPTTAEYASDPIIQDAAATTFMNNYLNTAYTNKINNVKVDSLKVTISSGLPTNTGNLYLCELKMYNPIFKPENIDFSTALSPASNIQTVLDRYVTIRDTVYDRIYSRWVIAEKNGSSWTYRSNAHFADDIDAVAKNYLPEVKPTSKKGLAGFSGAQAVADIAPLGIKSVTVNITYASILSLSPTSLPFVFNGETYYMNPNYISDLDLTFKGCSDNHTIVSAIILIPNSGSVALKAVLTHPDAQSSGIYSMANVASLTGVSYYAAITAFLADRYSRPDNLYGRITNWIIHNEVDAGSSWTNAGTKSMQTYTELYDRSMRTVYYTIRQYNPSGKVFISMTHYWTAFVDYAPKDMLALMNNLSLRQGDYEWGLAYHPYPQSLFNYNTWNDTQVNSDLNSSPLITPKNIELIDTWIRQKSSLYKGLKVRSLIFSEQGINAGANYDQTTFNNQAAGVAYMWKKFSRLPSVEGIQYHRRVDNTREGGLFLGLWTTDKTSSSPEVQDYKKKSWEVWQSAGTSTEASTFAFALPIIGVSSWDQTFNPLVGEVDLCKIDFNLTSQDAVKNDLYIYFNGERHKTETAGAATFYNVASLSNSRSYQIKQGNQLLWPAVSTTISADQTINVNLDPINNLTATPQSSTSIKLDWQDITDFEKGYVLESKTSDQTIFTKLADINANTTTFTNTGLTIGKTYQYRLYAYNDTVKTLYSKVVQATIDVNTAVGDDVSVLKSISIYPNPSYGDIYLNIKDKTIKKFDFKLFDLSGKQIFEKEIITSNDVYKISLERKPDSGIYIAKIIYGGSSYQIKVLIK
jgi:hypothetical protein